MLTIKKLEKKHIPASLRVIVETRVVTNKAEAHWLMEHSLGKGRHVLKPTYYILFKDETIIGVSGLYQDYEDPSSVRWLDYLSVTPKLQGQGYGTKMIKNLENICKKEKVKMMCVFIDNRRAIKFYQKNKFKIFGKIVDYYPHAGKTWLYKKL